MTFGTLIICLLIAALIVAIAMYLLRKKDPAAADRIDDKVGADAKAAGTWLSDVWGKLRWKK